MATQANKTPAITTTLEDITPTLAQEYLLRNTSNRALIETSVTDLVAAYRGKTNRLTHQGIAFGADGQLYDGQHRLVAIARSGVTVRMFVTRGLPKEAREAIDRGRTRSAADNLAIVEGITLNKSMAAALSVLWCATVAKSATRGPNTSELRRILGDHFPAMEAVGSVFKSSKKGTCRAAIQAAFIFAYPTDPKGVMEAAQKLYDGTELQRTDPMYVLREHTLRTTSRQTTRAGSIDEFHRTLGMIASSLDNAPRTRVMVPKVDGEESPTYARFASAHKRL